MSTSFLKILAPLAFTLAAACVSKPVAEIERDRKPTSLFGSSPSLTEVVQGDVSQLISLNNSSRDEKTRGAMADVLNHLLAAITPTPRNNICAVRMAVGIGYAVFGNDGSRLTFFRRSIVESANDREDLLKKGICTTSEPTPKCELANTQAYGGTYAVKRFDVWVTELRKNINEAEKDYETLQANHLCQ